MRIARNKPAGSCLVGIFSGVLLTLIVQALLVARNPMRPLTLEPGDFEENPKEPGKRAPDSNEEEHNPMMPGAGHGHDYETELSKVISKNVRVLCWIMTGKKVNTDWKEEREIIQNTETRAIHVNATWAPRCNAYYFVSVNESSPLKLPNIDLNVTEGRNFLWEKTKVAFKYLYDHYLDQYDWFLKADDDTYVIVENLRFMLLAYSPSETFLKMFVKQGYMSGGAGYVVSREGLRRFVEEALPNPEKCKQSSGGAEDAEFGKCAFNVGIVAGDSRDRYGRHRMLPFSPGSHMQAGGNKTMPNWFWEYMKYPYKQGEECCSDYMVSFHYVNKATMYSLDYLLYHVRPFALKVRDPIPEGKTAQELLEYAKNEAILTSAPTPKTQEDENLPPKPAE